MARLSKEMNMVLIVALIAVVAIVLVSVNAGSLNALNTEDGNFIGQALSAFTGKCTQTQKSTCQQMQQRCATMKGTWSGNCNSCVSKCTMPKK